MIEPPQDRTLGGGSDASPTSGASAPALDLQLPKFISPQSDGLYVKLHLFDSRANFFNFIDLLFGSSLRFAELDYASMQKLLYELEPNDIAKLARDLDKAGKLPILRLATSIVPFPSQRQQCYRSPKPIDDGDAAEYLFEPVLLEPEPLEAADADAESEESEQMADDASDNSPEWATLDFDEFVAAMWCKQVRFGIDAALVKKALAGNKNERLAIARIRPPTAGCDASVAELIGSLHRNNAPKLLADGRVDLRQYQNRFPQVAKNTRLVKKVPRILGKSGWDIGGNELAPEIPRDFDIATLAGLGTRVDRTGEGEFVVTELGGFLQIDGASQSFSISEKIVNLEGVSLRTTGNLALSGEEYEEHGVVHERAQIEGRNMTFMADVFGNIESHGGRVVLKQNLMSGSVRNPGGSIHVEGNASRATLEAIDGDITVHYAESCRIVGGTVRVEKAVHCDILAHELFVELSEGSALAAHAVQVGASSDRHDVETTISMLVPDLSAVARQLDQLKGQLAKYETLMQHNRSELEKITGQQEIKTYLLLNAKLRAKELTMTAEQSANWQKLAIRVKPVLKQLEPLTDELRKMSGEVTALSAKIGDITRESEQRSKDISCNVASITGDTVVRTLMIHPEQPAPETLAPRDLHTRLRESGTDSTILFNDSDGEFAWEYRNEKQQNGEE